jgi:predicted membrane protein
MFPALNSLAILLLVLFLLTQYNSLLILALILLIINTLFKDIAEPINKYLELTLKFFGEIISKLALFLVFYVFLTPIAFLYRMKNKNPLNLTPDTQTLWKERNKEFSKEDFEKPF